MVRFKAVASLLGSEFRVHGFASAGTNNEDVQSLSQCANQEREIVRVLLTALTLTHPKSKIYQKMNPTIGISKGANCRALEDFADCACM